MKQAAAAAKKAEKASLVANKPPATQTGPQGKKRGRPLKKTFPKKGGNGVPKLTAGKGPIPKRVVTKDDSGM